MDLKSIIEDFYSNKNEENSQSMAAYMKNHFDFLGIKAPERKALSKDFIKVAKKSKEVDWQVVDDLWQLPQREFQYLACDYLKALEKHIDEKDIHKLKDLVTTKSWWDSVDSLDTLIGNINFPSQAVDETMIKWSLDDNIWLRRVAINHQRSRKEKTKTDILEEILLNNLKQTEFFINKAMGWALREYSKTNPSWVKDFIENNKEGLSKLTIREGSKYLK